MSLRGSASLKLVWAKGSTGYRIGGGGAEGQLRGARKEAAISPFAEWQDSQLEPA